MAYKTRGIDVQHWQGGIDFDAVKASGMVDFAIIKAGGSDKGCYTDSYFERNYAGFKRVGIPVGAYYYVGPLFIQAADGLADAKRFEAQLAGKQFEMPMFVDIEANFTAGKTAVTDATIAFCDYLESKGYFVGIYGSDIQTFQQKLELDRIKKYTLWVARYRLDKYTKGDQQGTDNPPKYVDSYGMWQFAQRYRTVDEVETRVPGIQSDRLDRNYCYINYPSIIKTGGFNGFTKQTTPDKPVVLSDITVFQMTEGDLNQFIELASKLGLDYAVE